MPPTQLDAVPDHLRLWRRFHDALERDAERLAGCLVGRPAMRPHEAAAWWDHFAPAITQCHLLMEGLRDSLETEGAGAEYEASAHSSLLRQAVEAMGLAVGIPSAARTNGAAFRVRTLPDRVPFALQARELVRHHASVSVAYLLPAMAPDDHRAWERRAVAGLTYRNLTFLAPWLLDAIGGVERDALWRATPHLRMVRCDGAWVRRYEHVTAFLRQP